MSVGEILWKVQGDTSELAQDMNIEQAKSALLEEILGGLPKKKPAISYTAGYLPSEMEQNIYNSAVEDCEDKIKELFK